MYDSRMLLIEHVLLPYSVTKDVFLRNKMYNILILWQKYYNTPKCMCIMCSVFVPNIEGKNIHNLLSEEAKITTDPTDLQHIENTVPFYQMYKLSLGK